MFGLIFIIFGLICLFIAYVVFRQHQHFTNKVVYVTGQIVDIQIRQFSSQNGAREQHNPIVRYQYQGKTWEFESEYDIRSSNHQIGTLLKVYINPDHPTLVCSEKDIEGRVILMFSFSGLGIMLPIGGVLAEIKTLKALIAGEYKLDIHPMFALIFIFMMISIIWQTAKIFRRIRDKKTEKTVWGLSCNSVVVDD